MADNKKYVELVWGSGTTFTLAEKLGIPELNAVGKVTWILKRLRIRSYLYLKDMA